MSEERPTGWEGADRWFASPPEGEEQPAASAVPRCEVCGAGLETDQTYCLECGSPTPLAPPLRRDGRRFAIAAAAVAVVALVAGAVAFAAMDDDPEPAAGTVTTAVGTVTSPLPPDTSGVPGTGPLPPDTSLTTPTAPTAPGTTGFETVTGPSTAPPATTDEPPAETEPEPEPEPEPQDGASDWPAGRTAWTAVVSSVRDESDARGAKSALEAAGQPGGVLFSTDFPGFRPGYWVVFSGVYDSRARAIDQASVLRSEYPGAYARRIEG
jgi:type IV secretory pathway VirB10-like protein